MNDYRAYVMCDYCSIYHFGTDGMKWGKRRYQNEDGSYKPGAEGRYYDPVGKEKRPSSKKEVSKERVKSEEPVKTKKTNGSKKESEHKVRHFISTHKKEIAIGAGIVAGLAIGGIVLHKSGFRMSDLKKTKDPKKLGNFEYDKFDYKKFTPDRITVDRATVKRTDIPTIKVDRTNSTRAAVEAARKAAESTQKGPTNARTVAKGAENLAKATKEQQTEAQKIIDAVDSGSDYVNQLLKENEEMLKKIRNGGA